jgi:hypothetical protein
MNFLIVLTVEVKWTVNNMVYSMKLGELDFWVKNKAQPGDYAYSTDPIAEKHYEYFYIGPDENPYWREVLPDAELCKLLEKEEDSNMGKRCDNCKHYKYNGNTTYAICLQKDQIGTVIPAFTVCSKHEAKEECQGPLDNLKFFLKNKDTGELDIKYICEDCGKVMEKPFHWQFKIPIANNRKKTSRTGYYFYCEECWNKKAGE